MMSSCLAALPAAVNWTVNTVDDSNGSQPDVGGYSSVALIGGLP